MTGSDEARDLDRRLMAAMAAAQRGERSAYEALLRDCVPIIRRMARGRGASGDQLDDIVQDVLITLHGARQAYDPDRSFLAWLTVITQRRTVDLLRSHGRRAARETHDDLVYETHAAPDDPAREAERREEAARLRATIATLPAGQRTAIEAIALNENSLEDASKSTGRTKTALKVNLHRAIATLRTRMGARTDK